MSRLLIEGAAIGCSPIRFRQRGDRITADFICSARQTDTEVDYSGTATPRSVDLRVSKTAEFSAMTPGGSVGITRQTQSRLFANRLGDCNAAGTAQPPQIRNPTFTASVPQEPLEDDMTPAPEVTPRDVAISDPAQPDDIVVVARKLMNLRLRYASDGRIMTNCSNTRPSGDLQERYGVKLLAVSRGTTRITERLRDVSFRSGDMLVLQAGEKALPELMRELGLLPLAERVVRLGSRRQRYAPIGILAGAIVLVALKLLPVAVAFFGAAVLVIAIGALSMREAYGALEPEVLVLIGALTPLSEAVQHSGGTALIAQHLTLLLHGAAPLVVLGALMLTAMACSPFLHNAPTVLVLGPIGLAVAQGLHLNPDPFLMAVATGAGCDFLTPVGHQCNTLVMAPGGYRFGDYWRLGLPLSLLVIAIGTPLIAWVWPLGG